VWIAAGAGIVGAVGAIACALAVMVRSAPPKAPSAKAEATTVGVGAVVAASNAAPSSADPPPSAPPPAAVPDPEPEGEAVAVPTAGSEIPSGMGLLKTSGAAPGRRVFVNGRVAGQTPRSILVRCGAARVKIGSSGHAHLVDIPCGSEIRLGKR
jgi:serine/threonine-protein kinase